MHMLSETLHTHARTQAQDLGAAALHKRLSRPDTIINFKMSSKESITIRKLMYRAEGLSVEHSPYTAGRRQIHYTMKEHVEYLRSGVYTHKC